jgi:hypothetical protein
MYLFLLSLSLPSPQSSHRQRAPPSFIASSQVGSKLSYADVRLFDLFEDSFDDKAAAAACVAANPRVGASVAAVKAAAAGWLAARPITAI